MIRIDKDGEQEYDDESDSEDDDNTSDDNNSDEEDNSDDESSKEEIQHEISEFKALNIASIPDHHAVAWFKNDSNGKLAPVLFFNQANQVFRFDFSTKKSTVIFKGQY